MSDSDKIAAVKQAIRDHGLIVRVYTNCVTIDGPEYMTETETREEAIDLIFAEFCTP